MRHEFPAISPRSEISRRTALKYLAGFGLGFAATWGAGCQSAPTPTPAPPQAFSATPAVKGTKALTIFTALNESTNKAFVAAFKVATPGVDVSVLPYAATGELQALIREQKDSPVADVFVGGSSEYHDALAKEGLLQAYKSPNAAAIDPLYKDPSGFWTGWYIGILGMVLNAPRFASEMVGVKKPTEWDDLLDPAWKGQLILPNPATTGAGYIFLATQVFRMNRDEDAAMNYMRKLNGNTVQYISTSPQGIQLVSAGQFMVYPNWAHDILTALNQGQPVELLVPPATGFEVGAVSIVKGGPHPEVAQQFVDWVLTREAGEHNVQLSNRLSVRKDVGTAPGAPTLDQVQLVNYDRAWASANKDRLVKKWQQAIT